MSYSLARRKNSTSGNCTQLAASRNRPHLTTSGSRPYLPASGIRPHLADPFDSPKQEWHPRRSSPAASPGAAAQKKWVPLAVKKPALPLVISPDTPQSVQEFQDKLARRAIKCTICFDMVGRSTPIWSCSACFSIFHLHCICKWARSPASIASSDWLCPGCRTPQSTPARDLSYSCFCGRLRDPPYNLDLTPHSCGKPCGKSLGCAHVCALQCHPGCCPPCSASVPRRKCPCGKADVDRSCFNRHAPITCGQSCNHLLRCGRHTCERSCHTGACGSCKKTLTVTCFCGEQIASVLCADIAMNGPFKSKSGIFSCNGICGRRLLCGNHLCRRNCHPGFCGECELRPGNIRACHCGKKKLVEERKSCLDPIPICSSICGKSLSCKIHFCKIQCHEDDCPPCAIHVQQRCRCGWRFRFVECHQLLEESSIFICEKICGRRKNCGRHRCTEQCCLFSNSDSKQLYGGGGWDSHLCSLPCRKQLKCGIHTCPLPCHGGPCPPCLETIWTELTCACGKTSIPPPVPCSVPPLSCPHPCLSPQLCGHAASHSCHSGDCPPCTVCATKVVSGHVMLRKFPSGEKVERYNHLYGPGVRREICNPNPWNFSPPPESGVRSSCRQICAAPVMDYMLYPKIDILLESSLIKNFARMNLAKLFEVSSDRFSSFQQSSSLKLLVPWRSKAGTRGCSQIYLLCSILKMKEDEASQVAGLRNLSIQAATPAVQIPPAYEVDSSTRGAKTSITIWGLNNGRHISANCFRLNLLGDDAVLESASDWEESCRSDSSALNSGDYIAIEDADGRNERDKGKKKPCD